ncbi:MAG: fibronectin type III domain-containing protein [Planctomycetes bacterium]|nr:fibronectin type III domain-containing protein [Planctomycetota bacterium]
MKTSTTIRFTRFALAALVIVLCAVTVRGSASSTNYRLIEESSPASSGNSYSTNFKLMAMIDGGAVGTTAASTNYRVDLEFIPIDFLPDDLINPVITAGPTVIYVGSDRALIEWTTDEIADGSVDYGLTVAYGSNTADPGPYATLHQVLVTGLTNNTLYNFRVNSTDPYLNGPTQSANGTFTTSASADNTGPVVTPTVTILGVTAAQIDFTTDEAATTILRHGPTLALGTNLPDTLFGTSHTRMLTGLTAGITHNFVIEATDPSGNNTVEPNDTFDLPDAVAVSAATLPGGLAGEDYGATVAATGGVGALTFSISSGSLPPGLSITNAGMIVGTPTSAGTFGFSVQAADSGTPVSQGSRSFSITIAAPSGGGGGGGGGGCAPVDSANVGLVAVLAFGIAALFLRRRRLDV